MKKKVLLSVLALFVFSVFAISVNAGILQIPYKINSKAPSTVPNVGANIGVTVSEDFDFSPVTFETTDGTTAGSDHMEKLIIQAILLNIKLLHKLLLLIKQIKVMQI